MFRLEAHKYFEPVDILRGKVEEKQLSQFKEKCD